MTKASNLSDAARLLGQRGGKAGRGKSKRRSSAQMRKAALKRWTLDRELKRFANIEERIKALNPNGPMRCKDEDCVKYRRRNPRFAKAMQDAGIVAHYMGRGGICTGPGDYWMLDGITPVNRRGIEELMKGLK